MNFLREIIDNSYRPLVRPLLFRFTREDPLKAHELLIQVSRWLYQHGLEEMIFGLDDQYKDFTISNAAGSNKNGEIPPTILRALGFDRVNVGTVTGNGFKGNQRPNIRRYTSSESMVNWMGLPGYGAEEVSEILENYGNHGVPLTINLMSTPWKLGEDVLRDLEKTVSATRDLQYVDRYELNISCPNTPGKDRNIDVRKENLHMLKEMLDVLESNVYPHQKIYLKVSPDSTSDDIGDTLNVAKEHRVSGVVTSNTTTRHHRIYILKSPMIEGKQVGGASGDAVYDLSLQVQKRYHKAINYHGLDWDIVACGGINSYKRAIERTIHGAAELQIFTGLIFRGPGLLTELRM